MIKSIEIQYLGSIFLFEFWEVFEVREHKENKFNGLESKTSIYKGISWKRALKIARAQRTEDNCPALVVRGQG